MNPEAITFKLTKPAIVDEAVSAEIQVPSQLQANNATFAIVARQYVTGGFKECKFRQDVTHQVQGRIPLKNIVEALGPGKFVLSLKMKADEKETMLASTKLRIFTKDDVAMMREKFCSLNSPRN